MISGELHGARRHRVIIGILLGDNVLRSSKKKRRNVDGMGN